MTPLLSDSSFRLAAGHLLQRQLIQGNAMRWLATWRQRGLPLLQRTIPVKKPPIQYKLLQKARVEVRIARLLRPGFALALVVGLIYATSFCAATLAASNRHPVHRPEAVDTHCTGSISPVGRHAAAKTADDAWQLVSTDAMVAASTPMHLDDIGSLRHVANLGAIPVGRIESSIMTVQAGPPTTLPSLVLPPAANTEPALFTSLMRMGDTAMVRGDVTRARALYERAAATHPMSSAAHIAVGKTYDPAVLSLLGINASGIADDAKASDWYGRARALFDPAAASLLPPLR